MRLAFAAALAAFGLGGARAQEPDGPREDPDVVPAQFARPGVADPAPPVVRVQVRVPGAVAPKTSITYTMTVTNVSSASAFRVTLRHAVPEGAERPTFEPPPDNLAEQPPPKDYVWKFKELTPGKSRLVTATYALKPGVKAVRAAAFVSYEHGESVVTQVELPRLTLTKSAPERAMAGEPVPVRVEVANAGNVEVKGVELLETLPKGVEFRGDGEATANPQQRLWKLGSLRPGERKLVPYQMVAQKQGELLAISAVTAQDAAAAPAKESRTKVDTAGVALALSGPARVEAGGAGEYVATVTNTGTLPLGAVRVRAEVPEGCRPTAMSAGGRVGRDELVWDGPPDRDRGPLRAGEKFEVKFKLRGERAGERVVRASASAPGSDEQSAEARTQFEANSQLQGRADISPALVAAGEEGQLKYLVSNTGDGAAKAVTVVVAVPEGVTVTRVPARAKQAGNEIRFDPTDLPPGGEASYTLDFRGDKPANVVFGFTVTEAGGRGVRSTKEVAITRK